MPIAQGAYQVLVRSPKAVIYADPELQTPVGYVRSGKMIWVGEVKRGLDPVLPTVVYGRVAYIRTEDISLPEETTITKKSSSATRAKILEAIHSEAENDPHDENNGLLARVSYFKPDSASLAGFNRDSRLVSPTNISLTFEHRNPIKKWHWGFGLDYYSLSGKRVSHQTFAATAAASYSLAKSSFVSLELFTDVKVSGSFQVYIDDYRHQGQMLGLEGGAMIRLYPYSQYSLVIGSAIMTGRVFGMDNISHVSDNLIESVSSISGIKPVFIALQYKL